MSRLRICIDARLRSGYQGGVEQFIMGLAQGLSGLEGGEEEFHFLAYRDSSEWLTPYLSGPCRLAPGGSAPSLRSRRLLLRLFAFPIIGSAGLALAKRVLPIPSSDGLAERMQADILHLPKPDGFCTRLPFLYQPWDLQHLHFPQFFHPIQFWIRDRLYRSLCAQAKRVVVASAFTRGDLISQYDLPPERITTIPAAPVLPLYPEPKEPDLAKTRRKFGLPSRFLFFPAQTWPHKNHLALIDAQALIRQRHGLDVPIVCSGMKTDHYTVLEQRIKQHDLGRQFGFVGFVSAMEVRCLYQLCRGLVFPSKFEGFGLPVAEAFWAGVPVACSNATCLPELTGDAALQFPPDDTEAMAEAITRLWTDEELRGQLVSRGRQRVAALSWDRVARTYRALYRQVAGRELTTEDHQLLSGGT